MQSKSTRLPFNVGDHVSSESITTGKYLGTELFNGEEFHKVYDQASRLTLYVSLEDTKKLRALPSKSLVKRYLKIFKNEKLIDSDLIDGSRYKYFKSKLERVNFKDTFEVFHDLHVLLKTKKISTSVRRIYNALKTKVFGEISYVLEREFNDLEAEYLCAS